MNTALRPLWNKLFRFDWVFGLALILAICVPRFMLVLNANKTANYSLIGLIMLVSAITPFVFLKIKCKQQTGSLLGAIIAHAGFNLAMIYFIFYHL